MTKISQDDDLNFMDIIEVQRRNMLHFKGFDSGRVPRRAS